MTVKKISRRTSGSPQRSRAPVRAKPRAAGRAPPQHGVARESVDAIAAFAELAEREHLRWYLFGAQAVAAYGVPRTTGDVDITLDLGNRRLDALVAPLRRAGFVPLIADELFAMETRIYPVTHEPTGWNFDLVLAGPGLEQRFLDEVRWFAAGQYRIPVIAPEHLVTLKILAGRPKDLEDVRGMLRIAEFDHEKVESALAELESMLDQSDLRPVYARLRAAQRPTPTVKPRQNKPKRPRR
jgi:hypothetical protein